MSDLASRYSALKARIESAVVQSPFHPEVTLLAVSKFQPAESIAELYRLGHRDFAENYAQELLEKATLLSEQGLTDLRWHFIGHLQTNKVKSLLPHLTAIHSVDSSRLADEISKRATFLERRIDCFIELNLCGEPTKSGVAPTHLPELRSHCSRLPGIRLEGLMSIPSPELSSNELKASFKLLRNLGTGLPALSMGMSEDFELAISEGATHVRIGTALFGPRKKA